MADTTGPAQPAQTAEPLQGPKPEKRSLKWLNAVYKPVFRLGAGAQGAVMLARRRNNNEFAAVKTANLHAGTSALMTYREARFLQTLRMKNVIDLKDFYQTSTEYVLIMEACDMDLQGSMSLYAKSSRGGKERFLFPQLFVWRILSRLADALAYIHHHGVVHHDIKPGNVLLQWGGRDPETKYPEIILADFGAATSKIEGNYSDMSAPAYTSLYHPPDVMRGPTMDVWALGCIIHAIAHNRTPVQNMPDETARDAYAQAVWLKDPTKKVLKSIATIYSPELHHFMHSCLRMQPENRMDARTLSKEVREEWGQQLKQLPFEPLHPGLQERSLEKVAQQQEAIHKGREPEWPKSY